MSDADTTGRVHDLMTGLIADLRPVRRLAPAWVRALVWIGLVVAVAAVLAWFADMPLVRQRLMGAPDMWLAALGSTATAVLAAFAAFELGLPDRSPRWALLPLPGLALWLGASGVGCARGWLVPGADDASLVEVGHCMRFIIGLSIPLSAVILLLLRRGYSLHPTLLGGTAGLAVAAAAASLLVFFHPFDVTVEDLAAHALAVLIVVVVCRMLGNRIFATRRPLRGTPTTG